MVRGWIGSRPSWPTRACGGSSASGASDLCNLPNRKAGVGYVGPERQTFKKYDTDGEGLLDMED